MRTGEILLHRTHKTAKIPRMASELFDAAIRRIDEENSHDPNRISVGGVEIPYEVFYAKEVTKWVLRLNPAASEPLLLAARCQHICRWMSPRSSYPEGRAGYLKWRADLKNFHARKSAAILAEVGYPPDIIERVQTLNTKKGLGQDPEVQTLEDALCLVTLEHQLADLVRKTEHDTMVSILRKTWKKMSPPAHEAALTISYSPEEKTLIGEALAA